MKKKITSLLAFSNIFPALSSGQGETYKSYFGNNEGICFNNIGTDSNYFKNVSLGLFTAFVRDKKGCGVSEKTISILGLPKFFIPNGDGVNDSWNLIDASSTSHTNYSVSIFDRYGKRLAELKRMIMVGMAIIIQDRYHRPIIDLKLI